MNRLVAMLAIGLTAAYAVPDTAKADSASFVVPANSSDIVDLTVGVGEFLLTVQGDESSNLDFYVYDGEGKLIFADADETDLTFTTFVVAAAGGDYRLVVVNQGDVPNTYRVDLI